MPEAIENVFRHATSDVQGRINRVVEVWRTRSIFPPEVLAEVGQRLDTTRGQSPPLVSGSMNLPPELSTITATYTKLLGASSSSSLTLGTANHLYASLLESDGPSKLSADLYNAKAAQLMKSLEAALTNVQSSLSIRENLIAQLQTLVEHNSLALSKEKAIADEIAQKRQVVDQATHEALLAMSNQRSTTPPMEAPTAEALVS